MVRKQSRFIFILALTALMAFATVGAAHAAKGGRSSSGGGGRCSASPNPVASGADLTVSGTAGHNGDWVNVYVTYSDGYWEFMGGSVGGGGSFSLTAPAQETQTSFWGPFYPAPSGPASVDVYAGSANRNLGLVQTCTFSVS